MTLDFPPLHQESKTGSVPQNSSGSSTTHSGSSSSSPSGDKCNRVQSQFYLTLSLSPSFSLQLSHSGVVCAMDKTIGRTSSAKAGGQKPVAMALRDEATSESSRAYPEALPLPPSIPPSVVAPTDSAASIAPSLSRRRGSLPGFIHRAASHEVPTTRSLTSASGHRTMLRKKQRDQDEMLRQQRLASQIPKQPPQLPSPSPIPSMEGFGGGRPDSIAMFSGKVHEHQYHSGNSSSISNNSKPINNFSRPGYVAPSASNNSLNTHFSTMHMTSSPSVRKFADAPDPYATTESMTNRGRESYASLTLSATGHVNSPRRVRRKKDPTPFK